MEDIEEEEIGQMNAGHCYKFAKQHNILLTGCGNIHQFRERILLHLAVHKGRYYDIKREFGVRHSESLSAVRQTLDQLLDTVQTAMASLSPVLERALRKDSGGSDTGTPILQQIQSRRRALVTSECSVVVAGETNAGKSTFLNLLLGMDVLPTNIFSCTAAVCVLKHAPSFSAHVLYHDGRRQEASFQDPQSTKAWLDTVVADKDTDQRIKGLGIEAVHVYLPALILQSGVTLVDTPGIGESEKMTRYTMDYVKSHSAAAYLYVIKTDNAGGVHDDRLLEFLRAILHYNEQDTSSDVFDPTAAMFVCNRWDQVPAEQRQGVRDNALLKLKDVWPKFEPQQAFFMSSINAQVHFDSDQRYIPDDYVKVLKGLKSMFGQARHNDVNQHYRWLKQLLHQSTTFLQTAIHHCALSDDDLIARFKVTKAKLDALQRRTKHTTQQLRHKMRAEIETLYDRVRAMLRDPLIKARIMDWGLSPLPGNLATAENSAEGTELMRAFRKREKEKKWKDEMDAIIIRRIMDTVDEEITQRGLAKKLRDTLKTSFHQDLKLVDEDINSIVNHNNNNASYLSTSISSNASCASTDSDNDQAWEMLRLFKERDGFRMNNLKNVTRVASTSKTKASSADTMAHVPKMTVGRVLSRLADVFAHWRRKSLASKDPDQYMRDRAEKIMKAVSEADSCLGQMVAKYHEEIDSYISDVENSIPTFIAKTKQQMEDIRANRQTYLSQRRELVAMMENLEPTRDLLRGFGSLHIRDLTADNIFFTLDANQRRESVAVNVVEKKKVPKDSGLGESGRFDTRRTSNDSGPPQFRRLSNDSEHVNPASPKSVVGSPGSPGSPGSSSLLGTLGKGSGSSGGQFMQGGGSLWSSYVRGHVAIGTSRQDVMGRSYITPPPGNSLIKEIARLRCLGCDDLAPFMGMTHQEESAVFLFKGDLRPARRFLNKGFHKPCQSVPRLLEGVLRGLAYLHRQGLVHMELSLDTVMVNEQGEPRLCGACLPRRARLPPDADLILADPFMCLSPEVLKNELYLAEDDIFSFGLIVWETCLHDKPYRDYRNNLSLEDFRSKVHPSAMLGLDACEQVGDNITAVLRGCLLPARGLRMKMEELKERVSAFRLDPYVLSLSSAQRRAANRGFIKRMSSDDLHHGLPAP